MIEWCLLGVVVVFVVGVSVVFVGFGFDFFQVGVVFEYGFGSFFGQFVGSDQIGYLCGLDFGFEFFGGQVGWQYIDNSQFGVGGQGVVFGQFDVIGGNVVVDVYFGYVYYEFLGNVVGVGGYDLKVVDYDIYQIVLDFVLVVVCGVYWYVDFDGFVVGYYVKVYVDGSVFMFVYLYGFDQCGEGFVVFDGDVEQVGGVLLMESVVKCFVVQGEGNVVFFVVGDGGDYVFVEFLFGGVGFGSQFYSGGVFL